MLFLINTRWQLNTGRSPGLVVLNIHERYLNIDEDKRLEIDNFDGLPSATPRGIICISPVCISSLNRYIKKS